MTAFKVGDRVRQTVDKSPWGSQGEEGTILRFDAGLAEVKYDKSGAWWSNPRHLEPVTDAATQQPFPVGSYVRHLTSSPHEYFMRGDVTKVEFYNDAGRIEFRDRVGDLLERPASDFEAADEPRIEADPPAAPPRRIEIGDTFKALRDAPGYDGGDMFVVTGVDDDDDLTFTDNDGYHNYIYRDDAELVSSPRPFKAGDWVNTPAGRGLVVHDDGDPEGGEPYHVILANDPDYFNAADLTLTTPYGEPEPAAAEPEPANDNIRPGDIVQVTDRSSFNFVVRVGDLATVDSFDGEVYHLRFPRPLNTPLEKISYGNDIAPYPASFAA